MFVRAAHAQSDPHATGASPDLTQSPVPATGTEVGVEHEAEEGFAPLDSEFFASQILWLAITFGVLYFVMSRFLAPRIAEILENRRAKIASDIDAAERMRFDADAAQAAYEQELASARDRSHKIGQDARDAARADADAERRTNEAALDSRLNDAQARIADIKARALADVDAIAEETTETVMATLVGIDVLRDEVVAAVRAVRS